MIRRQPLAVATIASTLIAAAACSGSDPETLTVGDTSPPPAESTSTPTSPSATTLLPDLASLPLADIETDDLVGPRQFVSPAMGGLRFSISPDHTPAIIHDTVLVFTEEPGSQINAPRSTAVIQLVTQSVAGSPVSTVEAFLDTVEGVDDAVVEPTGDAIELFGRRLRGYAMSNGADLDEPTLFTSARFGAPVDTEFGTFPYALLYLADTPAGVLVAGVFGSDETNARQSTGALATLLATAELTGPGLDMPLPAGEVIEPAVARSAPEPAPVRDDGPPALETAFAPIEPGQYQLPNVGRQLTIDIEDGWFAQPNFPGIVVLTAPGSIGPGDRDLVMISGVVEYLPTEAGPRRGGDSTAVADVETLISAPPPGFSVSQISNTELGDVVATRFDLATDPNATCALGEPCEAALVTSYGVVKQLNAGYDHRIWWIEHPTGADTVFVATALDDSEFIGRATDLVETIGIS